MTSKKLGEIVRPIFERMGAKVSMPGDGTIRYAVTPEQMDRFFNEDPLGKAFVLFSLGDFYKR